MARLAGLVLAGGGSCRMGRDKAALNAKGKTLAALMMDKLRAASCDPVLLAGPGGVQDIYPGKGPLAGIHAAIDHVAGAQDLLIVPVDMPELCISSLRTLGGAEGAAVFYKGHSLPLKLRVSAGLRHKLEGILRADDADLSVRAFVGAVHGRALPVQEGAQRQWTNINTPADLARWRAQSENVS